MRVLYAVQNYPSLSGSYIETEVRAAAASGIDVHVWSMDATSEGPHPIVVPLHVNRPLAACIAEIAPDLVHTHYLSGSEHFLETVRAARLPYTLRAHGFEFSAALLDRLAADRAVARIFVFPHMAGEAAPHLRAKIAVLPAMYNPTIYRAERRTDPRMVLRVAAGLKTKNLEHFFAAAKLCPDHRFVLALTRGYDFNRGPVARFEALNRSLGEPVELLVNESWESLAARMQQAAIYMHTPPTHYPGMPISIAEAMASGCYVIAPDIAGMRGYLGASGGAIYRAPEEAAALIRETVAWQPADWERIARSAAEFAGKTYSSSVVVKTLVEHWRQVIEERRRAPFPLGILRRGLAAFRGPRARGATVGQAQ